MPSETLKCPECKGYGNLGRDITDEYIDCLLCVGKGEVSASRVQEIWDAAEQLAIEAINRDIDREVYEKGWL